jgi:hypothetical protein
MSRCVTMVARCIVVSLALVAIPSCVTESVTASDGRPMPPKPRAAAAPPRGAMPNAMTLVVAPPGDSDGNGFPDKIPVESALFALPSQAPLDDADGAFVFTLYRRGEAKEPDAAPIAEWRFEGDAIIAARGRRFYGACYAFSLSLLDRGTDKMPAVAADLRGRYESASGAIVRSSEELRLVQLGR